MKRRWLYALLGVLLSVPLLAGNFRVGKPQQSNQSQPLGRYAFLPIEGADSWPRRVNELGYVLAGTDLWHPAHGLLIDSAGGWFRDLNNSNQVIVQRDGTNGTTLILKNLATDAETVMTSGFAPPDEYVTGVEILDRASLHGGVPANLLNDLGQTVGHVWEPWAYTVRYTLPGGGYYTNTFMVPYSSLTGRWDGATQLLSLEGAQGVPAETHYSEVSYGQFTADQRVTVAVRDQNLDDHLILWDLSSNTANVYPANYLILINNAGHTVLQQRASSPAIEVVGQGVVGHGDAYAITDSQPPPYNTPDYPMIVGSSGGFPRIWSRFKDEEGSKVWEEIDPCSPDQKYSGTLTAANSNGLIVGSLSISNQQPKAYLLVPAALAVDANRDGSIKFAGNLHDTNLIGVPLDRTSESEPFRFWCNDDDDHVGTKEEDRVPVVQADSQDDQIDGRRDLEDFTRLFIHLGAFHEELVSGTMKVGLKWKDTNGTTPRVKLYRMADAQGSDSYLKDDTAAATQASGVFRNAIGEVSGTGTLVLPATVFANYSVNNPHAHLLFEASGEGKGQLCITIHKADGTEIGEGPGVWLDLVNVRKMYARAKATPESIALPHLTTGPTDNPPEPTMGWVDDPNGNPHDPAAPKSWTETKQYIVFVHGWNMSYEGSQNFAETMFKRLWHRGYKGRFASFRWPTLVGAVGTYNDSEYRAWKCGESLKQYVASLPSGYTKNLAAHSMGNIVAGSALKKGMQVVNYALLNAAVPAMSYDTDPTLYQSGAFWKSPTPDGDPDAGTKALGYGGQLQGVSGNLINFFLTRDFATTTLWEGNNFTFKPQKLAAIPVPPFTTGYYYDPAAAPGQRIGINYVTAVGRFVTTPHEAMAYAVHSRTRTIGAEGGANGAIDGKVDMDAYGFDTEHSAEFDFRAQQTTAFYNRLLDEFDIPFLP